MTRFASLAALPLLVAVLGGCGGDRQEEDVLMRRVAQAEAAAGRAEIAAKKAEDAAKRATSGSTADDTVYEAAPDMDESYGQPSDATPTDQG